MLPMPRNYAISWVDLDAFDNLSVAQLQAFVAQGVSSMLFETGI